MAVFARYKVFDTAHHAIVAALLYAVAVAVQRRDVDLVVH